MAEPHCVMTCSVKAPLCFEAAASCFCSMPPRCWLRKGNEWPWPIRCPQAPSITFLAEDHSLSPANATALHLQLGAGSLGWAAALGCWAEAESPFLAQAGTCSCTQRATSAGHPHSHAGHSARPGTTLTPHPKTLCAVPVDAVLPLFFRALFFSIQPAT